MGGVVRVGRRAIRAREHHRIRCIQVIHLPVGSPEPEALTLTVVGACPDVLIVGGRYGVQGGIIPSDGGIDVEGQRLERFDPDAESAGIQMVVQSVEVLAICGSRANQIIDKPSGGIAVLCVQAQPLSNAVIGVERIGESLIADAVVPEDVLNRGDVIHYLRRCVDAVVPVVLRRGAVDDGEPTGREKAEGEIAGRKRPPRRAGRVRKSGGGCSGAAVGAGGVCGLSGPRLGFIVHRGHVGLAVSHAGIERPQFRRAVEVGEPDPIQAVHRLSAVVCGNQRGIGDRQGRL